MAYAQPIEVNLGGLILTATDSAGVDWMADTLGGWYGSPASTIQLAQKPRAPGAWVSTSRQLTPRVIPISGFVQAPSPAALTDALSRLAAAASLNATALTVTEGGAAQTCTVYRQDVVLENRVSDFGADWSVQLVASDPRKSGTPIVTSTLLPATTGGITVPLVVPVVMAETVLSGACTAINPGNATGPVRMRIDGPVAGPVVTHVGTGAQLVLASSLVLNTGEWLDIDMEAHTVLANGTASRAGYLTRREWSGFEPGSNQWNFTASIYNSTTMLTVTATPSWL